MAAAATLMTVSTTTFAVELSNEEIDNLVRRAHPCVAMFNVITRNVLIKESPPATGWNGTYAADGLLDHSGKFPAVEPIN